MGGKGSQAWSRRNRGVAKASSSVVKEFEGEGEIEVGGGF